MISSGGQDWRTLDIGCGEVPKGDVNIDIYVPQRLPQNFVLASAEYLPFRDRAFEVVRSSYVLEHCTIPTQSIKEHIRCARARAIIITDNSEWLGDYLFRLLGWGRIFHPEHCYRWTTEYLHNLLARLGLEATVRACNLSPTLVVRLSSLLGKLPRIGTWFYRDIEAVVLSQRSKDPAPGARKVEITYVTSFL